MSKIIVSALIIVAFSIPIAAQTQPRTRNNSTLSEGKDYLVLERVRLLDTMGFDRPVEAMSILVPQGWKTEGGVTGKGINGCRGEIVTLQFSVTSRDGAIRFPVLPLRSFIAFQNQLSQQAAMVAAQQGGCQVYPPFNAARYLENLARNGLGGARATDIRPDESLQAIIAKIAEFSNATAQQYGTGINQSGSGVYGTLTWPDGSKGLAQVGVSVMVKNGQDMYTGAPNGFATTTVFHQAIIRYPPAREAEAIKLFGMFLTSHRMNPVWQKAKDNFLTNSAMQSMQDEWNGCD